jgi:CMP/dCMP kinase
VGSGSDAGTSRLVIAMDGTAGSGKSSASRGVAAQLGLRYLDTGAMYRAMTWQMLLDGIDVYDADAVAARADTVEISSGLDPMSPTIRLGGVDVGREVRTGEVNVAVSPVSAVPRVRERLAAQQREIIGDGGIVVEGRDIGSVVVPDAPLKVYLTASEEIRAARREAQDRKAGRVADHRAVLADVRRRDRLDSTRKTSPLHAAPDALVLDTDELSVDDVLTELLRLVEDRGMVT